MTLRTKLLLWFIALHLVFAGLAVVVLMDNQSWLFVVELFFAVSIISVLYPEPPFLDTRPSVRPAR